MNQKNTHYLKIPVILAISVIFVSGVIFFIANQANATTMVGTPMYFSESNAIAGISMTHNLPSQIGDYFLIGQAWGDYDGDGWLDLYLTGAAGPNKLFNNNGDGTFSEVLSFPQLFLTETLSTGANFVDVDNDGWLDLYVLSTSANHLFKNIEGQAWEDISASSQLDDKGRGQTSAWADFDNDQDLDVYVVNWACDTPECINGYRDGLYINDGSGVFTDISTHLSATGLLGPGFAASSVDFDNDGDLDIYVVNDKNYGNVLWRNEGSGCDSWCFSNVAASTGSDTQVFGMGLATGDYDNDFDLDFFFTDIGPSTLLQNQTSGGTASFLDVSVDAGVAFDAIGWGAVFLDYNNDGWLDIYQAVMNSAITQTNRLFENVQDGTFSDVSAISGANHNGPTLGVSYADYDRDGWLDIVIGNLDEGYYLYHNEASISYPSANWIDIELIGAAPVNGQAIGSRVYLTMTNGLTQMQEVKNGSSLGAGNTLALHFGLGDEAIAALRIDWPDGSSTFVDGTNLPVNSHWYHQYPQAGCNVAMTVSDGVQQTISSGGAKSYIHTVRNDGNCRDGFFINWESTSSEAFAMPAFLWLDPGESGEIAVNVVVNGHVGDETTVSIGSVRDESLIEIRTNQTTVNLSQQYLPLIRREG